MSSDESTVVGGGSSSPSSQPAPKGRRFASALIDLLIVPIFLGIIAGLILLAVPEGIRNGVLIAINILWLLFRDFVFSPGRRMVGLKLVSDNSSKITIGQAFIRNILIMIPFVLVVGYVVELIFIATKGVRLADGWAKTRVVVAA
jgi:uncharacterized RDD family membrane protein YckC